MSEKEKSTHTMPGARQEDNSKPDDGVVNDSFGTVDPADTTGTGEENEPCESRDKSVGRENPHQENNVAAIKRSLRLPHTAKCYHAVGMAQLCIRKIEPELKRELERRAEHTHCRS